MYIYDLLRLAFDIVMIYAAILALMFYMRGQRQKKRAVTLEFIKRWNEANFQSFFTSLVSASRRDNRNPKELVEEWASTDEESKDLQSLRSVWNFFEELAIAILFREADQEMAKEFFFYTLVGTYKLSDRAIESFRQKANNKALYVNIERLFGRWAFDKEISSVREVN